VSVFVVLVGLFAGVIVMLAYLIRVELQLSLRREYALLATLRMIDWDVVEEHRPPDTLLPFEIELAWQALHTHRFVGTLRMPPKLGQPWPVERRIRKPPTRTERRG
jgi:hypothetical protein